LESIAEIVQLVLLSVVATVIRGVREVSDQSLELERVDRDAATALALSERSEIGIQTREGEAVQPD
jgi:hypothetical protein